MHIDGLREDSECMKADFFGYIEIVMDEYEDYYIKLNRKSFFDMPFTSIMFGLN